MSGLNDDCMGNAAVNSFCGSFSLVIAEFDMFVQNVNC